jgi:AraC-like DNA-binding protein
LAILKKGLSKEPIVLHKKDFFPNPKTNVGLKWIKGQSSTKTHQHEFVEIAIITNGSAIQLYDDIKFEVTKGDVFVIRPNHPHTLLNAQELDVCNILYMDNGSIPLIDELSEKPEFKALFQLEPTMRNNDNPERRLKLSSTHFSEVLGIVTRMQEALVTKAPASYTIATIHLLELITMLCDGYAEMPAQESRTLTQLSRVISYIEINYKDEIRVEDLARMANMSVRTFQRHFQLSFEMAPSKYILKYRIKEARKLLELSNLSISEVAFNVGFEESTYFSRAFRKEIGKSPQKYRTNLRS